MHGGWAAGYASSPAFSHRRMLKRHPGTARPRSARDVLLVGANRRRIAFLGRALESYGFDVQPVVCNSRSAPYRVPARTPKVIVADAPPPVTARHVDLLLHLRQRWESVPMIAMTANDNPSVLTGLLALGIDDFTSHSSQVADLVVRLRRQLVRAGAGTNGSAAMLCDAIRHTVVANGRTVALTTREFGLYSCLAEQANKPVSRREIVRRVWGERTVSRSLHVAVGVYVFHLRQKLGKLGLGRLVHTVRGEGYMLVDDRKIH
jgi:DNA-binding response OmpR family regulator